MLRSPEVVICVGKLLDMTAIAVICEFKRMQVLAVVLLENRQGVAQVLSVSLGEEVGDVVLAFRAYLLGMLTHRYKVHNPFLL
jgi:hypothetical protein